MAAGTMATAAGAAVLLYFVLSRRISAAKGEEEGRSGNFARSARSIKRRLSRRPAQAPATWLESITTLTETLRFTYAETLGKWPIGDLAFGINYLMRRQGNLHVASVYAGSDSVQLNGPEIIEELNYYLRLLTLCILFSKKPFLVFLESAGFSEEDVLLQKPKAGLMMPAFTIIRDKDSKCFLLLIRGTHSIKDTLTAATGAVVPFHHSVLHDGGISNLVLGYSHCGMVAAARWIAKLSNPFLLKALAQYPDYNIKIVGHSLGGGTAALLTYILREQREFSSSTCITFAPAACMTWELAESGKHFITTIINGADLVPTFSTASIDDLRSEVTESSWLNDLRDQVERTRILNVVYRSATAVGSRLPSIASAKARVAGAGALLRPVSSSTQVVMKRAQNMAQAVVRTRSSLSSWSCMGARRRNVGPALNPKDDQDLSEISLITENHSSDPQNLSKNTIIASEPNSPDSDSDSDELVPVERVTETSTVEDVSENELWYELAKELHRQESDEKVNSEVKEIEAAVVKEITEEENMIAIEAAAAASSDGNNSSPIIEAASENHHLYPPGRIMHIVAVPSPDSASLGGGGNGDEDRGNIEEGEERVGIYETRRELYSKLRLSRTMIKDHYMPMYKKMMELLIHELENLNHSTYVM